MVAIVGVPGQMALAVDDENNNDGVTVFTDGEQIVAAGPHEAHFVRLSDEMFFTWHRPPVEEVERQAKDQDTVRILLNGCFDLMHVGHFNALRQAKDFFYRRGHKRVVMVAGLHSDAAITRQKGEPLVPEVERAHVLRATKWVDEILVGLPYVCITTAMADALKVDWVVHGDDLPVCKDGGGMYADVIDGGRFQVVKRTRGISTTIILQRLLGEQATDGVRADRFGSVLATAGLFASFSAPADPKRARADLAGASKVVYVPGVFDLLHEGHVELLERAAACGDFLLVGLHSDGCVCGHLGASPVLTLAERALAILSLRCVDEVVLDAPWGVSADLLQSMNISVVVAGHAAGIPGSGLPQENTDIEDSVEEERLGAARTLGVLKVVMLASHLTSRRLQNRFFERRDVFAERNGAMVRKELEYVGLPHRGT